MDLIVVRTIIGNVALFSERWPFRRLQYAIHDRKEQDTEHLLRLRGKISPRSLRRIFDTHFHRCLAHSQGLSLLRYPARHASLDRETSGAWRRTTRRDF